MHGSLSNLMLGGAKLTIYDYTNNSAVYEDTANAITNFKYVICIDSSTCIAADDSTALSLYKMDVSTYTVTKHNGYPSDNTAIRGIAYIKAFNIVKVFTSAWES